MDASTLQLIILPAGIIAVLFAMYLARDVLARDTGTQAMQDVAGTIFEGAVAFIRRQYTTIGILAVVGAVVIGLVITIFETADVADTKTFGLDLGWRTGLAFIVGAACSMASGIIGMYISVKSNVRTAAAARRSLVEAVQVAMRGGAVSGFLVVALSNLKALNSLPQLNRSIVIIDREFPRVNRVLHVGANNLIMHRAFLISAFLSCRIPSSELHFL